MTNEEKTQHIAELERQLVAQRLANDALAEKLRAVTVERDRYFDMKRYNAGRFAEVRTELHRLKHEARAIVVDAPLGQDLVNASVDFVAKLANG